MEKIIVSVVVGIISAFLGAYAGKEGTSLAWRRFGIPVLLLPLSLSSQHLLGALLVLAMAIPLSLGYGLPSNDDEGSPLGRLAVKLFGRFADVALRCALFVLTLLPLYFIGNSTAWLITVPVGALLVAPFVGDTFIRNEPYIWGLNTEDLWYYGVLGFVASWVLVS